MAQQMNKWSENDASDFIVRTCQLLPKSCAGISDPISTHDASIYWRLPISYSIYCGSSEEFSIRPLNSCIDDTDELMYNMNMLALEEDFPVLPKNFSRLSDAIDCYKIEPYLKYPGFVRLRILGKMIYSWKHKTYEFSNACVQNGYAVHNATADAAAIASFKERPGGRPNIVRGPAITIQNGSVANDAVTSLWCPQWPKEAEKWPKRPRNFGWPTSDTISEIVQRGCHVVNAQHRECKHDEFQWRLSFSVAEVILLQSWTPVQQIVYHLLRFFAKSKLIRKDCKKEDEIICTYHIKTLMLWTCEKMPPEWWNCSSVFTICCKVLETLSEFLKMRCCQNYFIPASNLFHEQWNTKTCEQVEDHLNTFCDSGILCDWFVENYILAFTRKRITKNTGKVNLKFLDIMQYLLKCRKANKPRTLDILFSIGFAQCNYHASHLLQSEVRIEPRSGLCKTIFARKCELLRNNQMPLLPMPESVQCFTYFDKMLFSLHAAYALTCGQISSDIEFLAEYFKGSFLPPKPVRCQYHILPKPLTVEESKFRFFRAQDFMEDLTGSNSRSEQQLMSLLSKELFTKVLECDDCESDSTRPATLVYLAALHFAASENQIVSDLCSVVLMDETSNTDSELLNGGCLFFIDDVVRIVGFCLLHKRLNETMDLNNKQIYLDLRLTPKMFAYYLIGEIPTKLELNLRNATFPLDQVFLVFAQRKSPTSITSNICDNVRRQCISRTKVSIANLSANCLIIKDTLIGLLLEYALENMTLFYSGISKDFRIHCNTADCYRALHLYKCQKYNETLQLCEQIIHEPDLKSDLMDFAFANALVLPLFFCFFDEDVQSLVGFRTLFFYLLPLNGDFWTFNFSEFIASASSCSTNRSMYPLGRDSVKHNYFLGRHFVARYLKLRCLADCNQRYARAMSEFADMKIRLPFERMIRRLILRKLDPVRNNSNVTII